jgi:uncharacterized protein (DUF342 family)
MLDLEKDIKDVIEKNKLQTSQEISDLSQRANQSKRDIILWKDSVERRIMEIGEDGQDLKSKLEGEMAGMQSEMRSESNKLRVKFEEFETGVKLKWERLMNQYKEQIEQFESNLKKMFNCKGLLQIL